MTFPLTKLYGATLWLMLPMLACGSASGDDLGDAVKAAIAKVEPSVVRLRVIGGEQSVDGDTVASLVTTGIVISADGEILTSQFALEGNPEAVLVEDQLGKRTNATIIATDRVRRIVLLKAKEGHWTPAAPDESRPVEVGQWSIALGRFYAAESSSISLGIISALNRIHGMAIQTDAKVSPVNYGGPLVLLNGTIAGILVPLSPRGGGTSSSGIEWYDSGIGFAIPLKDALVSAEKLRSGKNLEPGRIGIRLAPTGAYDSDVVIDRVLKGGPSEQAGLLKGDQVLAIDGKSLERSSMLLEAIASRYAGDSVTFLFRRGDKEITAVVELVEALPAPVRGYLGLLPVRLAQLNQPHAAQDDASNPDQPQNQNGEGGGQPLDIPRIALPKSSPPDDAGGSKVVDSVPLIVINDSPVAAQNVPPGIELTSVNGNSVKSLSELGLALEEIVPGAVTKIEYRIPGETATLPAEITAGTRPATVTELSDDVLDQIQKSRPAAATAAMTKEVQESDDDTEDAHEAISSNGVARREFNFEERGRCVVLSSTEKSTVMPGIVILLAAHKSTEEEIVQTWGPVLHSHCLTLVIPHNPESASLTNDDIPLILTSVRAVVTRAGGDLRRVAVVADRTQASLAWQCTFGGPSVIRGIALTDGWIADNEIQGVDGAGHSLLLLDNTPGVQANALREISRKSLANAGFQVLQPAASVVSGTDTARCVADWSFLMRSF